MQHHVGGVVGAEVAVNPDNIGVVEAGERLGFLNKALKAPVVVAGAIFRARRRLAVFGARGEIGGEVFLDRDEAGERDFMRQIGHAEAARAEHPVDAEIARQFRAFR
jgi:hypothetical protein